MQQCLGAVGRPVGGCRCPQSQTWRLGRLCRLSVCAAKQGSSPWSTGPSKNSSSSSNSNSKSTGRSSSSKSSSSKQTKSSSSPKKKAPKSTSSKKAAPSGQGFGPQKQLKPTAIVHKLTAPLTPQLLDELTGWEVVPAPLWSTFTGHCEGEWLGQYAAYTPWGGDPEPVWADESGAYLLYAYSRASESREAVPLEAVLESDVEVADSDVDEDVVDMLVRKTLRSASISSLIGGTSAATAAAAASVSTSAETVGEAEAAAADDESEALAYNRNGCVVFNGGSYSTGPELLAAPEVDEDFEIDFNEADEELLANYPFSTVVIEQALVSSGDVRLRLVTTLKLRQPPGQLQELDVEPARLLLYKEYWYGTAESTSGLQRKQQQQPLQQQQQEPATAPISSSSSSSSTTGKVLQLLPAHKFDVAVTNLPRPQPQQMAGSWNVFQVSANPIVEENPDTLQDEEVFVYSSREERQQWHVPGLTSSAALGSSSVAGSSNGNGGSDGSADADAQAAAVEQLDDSGSGGSYWLPGGAVVTIKMVPWPASNSSSTLAGDIDSNGNNSSKRGLLVGLHWLVDDGSCLFVERQYDADGRLAEVRHGTAVKGGWSGGRM